MSQISNTFETYDAVGNRETLADTISMITPEETPFLSMIGKESVSGVHPEWQTDTLASPNTSNNVPEGNDWVFSAITPTTRVGNYCQISEKTFIISKTQEKVSKAGRKSEVARELSKKGLELKIDQEVIFLSNQASSAGSGNGATNRTLGALRAWCSTNDSLGAGGASGGFNSSTGIVDAATDGTQRAFTKALLDTNIENIVNSGGKVKFAMMSNYNTRVFSTFMSDSNVGQLTIAAGADVYVSDFGEVTVIPNTQMTRAGASIARNIFMVDPSKVKQGVLRPIDQTTPAVTGDSEKRVINTEYTLIVKNEAGLGVIADTFGLTSAS
jgi:hypothetical protein